jgi:hypothetical protein
MIWPVDDPPGTQTHFVGRDPGGWFWDFATGDVNGDGFADMIIGGGSLRAHTSESGEVYVVLGPIDFTQPITMPRQTALVFQGAETGRLELGTHVDSGDLNGDGYDDIIIGSLEISPTYVYLGSPTITSTSPVTVTATPEVMALTVLGGTSGLIACNINGDAYDDLFLEAPNDVWGVLGRAFLSTAQPITIDVRTDPVDITISGFRPEVWGFPSRGNRGCGDVDGDGFEDLVVGIRGESPGEGMAAGRVYIVRGSGEFTVTRSVTVQVPDEAGAIIEGADGDFGREGDMLGDSVAVADVNGDGRADLVLGAPGGDGPNNAVFHMGEVYLWPGQDLRGQTVDVDTTSVWTLYGAEELNHLGHEVDAADLNGDGRSEVIIGCHD